MIINKMIYVRQEDEPVISQACFLADVLGISFSEWVMQLVKREVETCSEMDMQEVNNVQAEYHRKMREIKGQFKDKMSKALGQNTEVEQ